MKISPETKAALNAAAKARWAKISKPPLQIKECFEPGTLVWKCSRGHQASSYDRRRGYHECVRCGYRWLGRVSFNGDYRPPKRCARCRSPLWNTHRMNHVGQGRRASVGSLWNVVKASS